MSEKEYTELDKMRHTGAHVLAAAVKMYMNNENAPVKFAFGPPIDNGFYYDFDFGGRAITEKDFKEIEKKMRWIVNKDIALTSRVVSMDEGRKISADEPFKLEQIADLEKQGGTDVSYYAIGNLFEDLCRGPHVESTGKIGVYKIDKVAGAYWKGDEKRDQLTRIYVLMFATQEELDAYLVQREEAEKRDHRKLGRELDLFTISPLVGSGLPLLKPKGMIIRMEIEKYLWDLHSDKGYSRVWTPHIAKEDLYVTSGHAAKFGDELFRVKGKEENFILKPMNCPHHMQIYADTQLSYRDLPVRLFEPATVYRDEKSGQLGGLTRVRSITQDDGHLFCRVGQIKDEVRTIVTIIKKFYETMGMMEGYWVSLSVRGEDMSKYLGSEDSWVAAETALEEAAKYCELNYKRVDGEAAFYGPKLDFMFKDAIGRQWQLATIQCDFNLPERFDLSYINEKGEKERPVVIHRAISGSLERFMGVMIEHFAGNFPTWLAPVQVKILTLNEEVLPYAEQVEKKLKDAGVRVELDSRGESIGKKIRDAETWKIPYSLVVGAKEAEAGKVALRKRHDGDKGTVTAEDFIKMIVKEIEDRSL